MRLPPELFDLVIEHFRNDKLTLVACATVCSEWRTRSQHYLFDTVILTSTDSPYTPANFLDLLESNPYLGTGVRSLVVQAGEGSLMSSPRKHLSLKTLTIFGQRLPNLRSLWLRGICWSPVYDSSASQVVKETMNGFTRGILKASHTVTSLRISDPPTHQHVTRFHSIFHIFPAVQEFTLENGLHFISPSGPKESPFLPEHTHFRKLALFDDGPTPVSKEMMFPKSAVETVTELRCPLYRGLCPIANCAKQSLLVVSLDLQSHDDFSLLAEGARLHTLRLWSSTSLQSFGLVVPTVLLKVPPSLQKLAIVFPPRSMIYLRDGHWDEINAALGRFTKLEVLEVLLMGPNAQHMSRRYGQTGDDIFPERGIDFQRIRKRLDERFRKMVKFGPAVD